MTINCFLSVSALLLQGRDRKREKKEQGSQNKQENKIVRERKRGPLIENSWQLIRRKGDPVYCTDRVGMCGQMMMTGSTTTLPLSVLAKTHHHWLTDWLPACILASLLVFQKKNTAFGKLFHDCDFTILCYIDLYLLYVTAIVRSVQNHCFHLTAVSICAAT